MMIKDVGGNEVIEMKRSVQKTGLKRKIGKKRICRRERESSCGLKYQLYAYGLCININSVYYVS